MKLWRFCVLILLPGLLATACGGPGTASPAGENTYRNPILPGFHPDPSIVRVGEDYYLATSTFEYFPGLPIYHSKDLLHWKQVGNVLFTESQLSLRGVESSGGLWAPTLRYHRGKFYLTVTFWQKGNFLFSADTPAGPWSAPFLVDREGIDPSLFIDEDGQAYYTRQGPDGIVQAEIDLSTGQLRQKPRLIWKGMGEPHLEGPHLYKINGMYYLLAAAGGTGRSHSVVVARGPSVWGPFEPAPTTPLLTHRHLPGHPIQATGHADLVQTQHGEWWAVLLAVRAVNSEYALLGRETFLAPVEWADGWPIINRGRPIELEMSPVPALTALPEPPSQPRYNFHQNRLGLGWLFVRGIPAGFTLTQRPGWLCLPGGPVSLDEEGAVPAFTGRRMTRFDSTVRARLAFSPENTRSEAGLVFREDEKNHYDLLVRLHRRGNGLEAVLRRRVDGQTDEAARFPLPTGPVILEAITNANTFTFIVRPEQGNAIPLGTLPASGVRTRAFTGLVAGLYAYGPDTACFDWLEFGPAPNKNPGE